MRVSSIASAVALVGAAFLLPSPALTAGCTPENRAACIPSLLKFGDDPVVASIEGLRDIGTGSVAPDGSRALLSEHPRVGVMRVPGISRLWTIAEGAIGAQLGATLITASAFSSDGSLLATGADDGTVALWDAATGGLLAGPLDGSAGDRVVDLDFSADGSRLGAAYTNNAAVIFRVDGGGALLLSGHGDVVRSIDLGADGTRVATGSNDQSLRIWDGNTGAQLFAFDGFNWVDAVAMSTDGSRAYGGDVLGRLRGYDLNSGSVIFEVEQVTPVGISEILPDAADGRLVVTTPTGFPFVLLDADTGEQIASISLRDVAAMGTSARTLLSLETADGLLRALVVQDDGSAHVVTMRP